MTTSQIDQIIKAAIENMRWNGKSDQEIAEWLVAVLPSLTQNLA